MTLPRDAILERIDLRALADELLGARRPRGPSGMWTCPAPAHGPQTGRTPPVSVFTSTRGEQRWRCHACGAGGTAIDLLVDATGLRVGEAMSELARRAEGTAGRTTVITATRGELESPPSRRAEPWAQRALAGHVTQCAEVLWTDAGTPVLEWLHARGLNEDVLRVNRVGADPGPRHVARARGLPSRGRAAILPIFEADAPVYLQARYLDPGAAGGRKYDNPATWIAANPRLAAVIPPRPAGSDRLFVCEGLIDALSVAQTGELAVAVLGAGLAGRRLAQQLHDRYPAARPVIAFDADVRGRDAAYTLADAFTDIGAAGVDVLEVSDRNVDLNGWLCADPVGFADTLGALSTQTARVAAIEPVAAIGL